MFAVREFGYDQEQVDAYLGRLDREHQELRSRLEAADLDAASLEARIVELTQASNATTDAAEAENVLVEARKRAKEIYVAAERERIALIADERIRCAREAKELDQLMASLACEAQALENMREHLDSRISRAATELVRIVDGKGGIGAYSEATANLLEFAHLLLRSQPALGLVPDEPTHETSVSDAESNPDEAGVAAAS